ncbi:sulfate/molybdate ABC transporter ATP-binding protein [[Clostridium] fimetarium]|uniref:Molybdate transport system ATP-binding protein n=1 Tax=[Clostridium] fimetarium TaxID=99656 RepID=A0A1I0RAE0_9FIRM|nr:ATP-binding cassette domain-containing protein [[Clostridium] fimetarium]SEW37677.1 molybdate transport system ATP-binding protein [[Clostridium] fimetarium]
MGLEVDIKKKIGKFELNVKFDADSRSHIGILGASGCGKSMTLKCIAGIVKPDEGRIVLNGKVLFDSKKKINLAPQKRKVGYLFQNYALFPNMTVEKNIAIGIRDIKDNIKNKTKKNIKNDTKNDIKSDTKNDTNSNGRKKEIVRALVVKFQLEGLEERYPSELSGGQQQRVALARMLANEPDIIMLDEPFSALDSFLKDELQREMFNIMKEYDGEVLMVSHSRDEVFKLTEKLVIMDSGKIITYNETKRMFENPEYIEAAKLTGCKNISKAIKIDDYQINATDWNVALNTVQKVPDNIAYVGIRAHHVEIDKSAKSINKLSVNVVEMSEQPFDTNYIVKNSTGCSGEIWIKVSNANIGVVDPFEEIQTIIIPPERLLLLI